MCFVIYYARERFMKKQTASDDDDVIPIPPKKMSPWLMAVPTFFDIAETALKNVALTLISTSISSMLKSSNLIFTTMLSVIFLKRVFYRHHYTSMMIIVLGIILVGLSSFTGLDEGESVTEVVLGIFLMIFG